MPRYCFECPSCSAAKEEIRSVAQIDAPVSCDCGSAMRRVLAPVRFIIPQRHQAVHDRTGLFDEEAERRGYEEAAEETQRTGTSSKFGFPVVRGNPSDLKNQRGLL